MTAQSDRHPADEIGKALSRAGGILSSLTNCYEKADTDFQISLPFVFEAVSAVEKLLQRATDELTSLYQSYDLSKISEAQSDSHFEVSATEEGFQEDTSLVSEEPLNFPLNYAPQKSNTTSQLDQPTPYLGFFGPSEQVSRLASRLDHILETMPINEHIPSPDEIVDKPAQTYNELLEKLTAMADAAAYQSHQTPTQDQNMLPILEKLRADMLRIRSVA